MVFAGFVTVYGLLGLLVMVLWNHFVVRVFGVKLLGYFEALGLFTLGRLFLMNIYLERK